MLTRTTTTTGIDALERLKNKLIRTIWDYPAGVPLRALKKENRAYEDYVESVLDDLTRKKIVYCNLEEPLLKQSYQDRADKIYRPVRVDEIMRDVYYFLKSRGEGEAIVARALADSLGFKELQTRGALERLIQFDIVDSKTLRAGCEERVYFWTGKSL